ncbi:MAG TPA: hypothetical protein PKM78_04070 [Anaerolineae bacterium]|nr:hypothetical protein [Anaerolineae bacterium]HNU04870.1 hypothetical protein [Anaerolineae bacterium]
MLRTHEATLHPDGMLSFRNEVSLKGAHRVLVTILDEGEIPVEPQAADTLPLGDVRRTMQLLSSPAFQARAYGSAAKMDLVIREHRDAWDE